MKSYLKPVSRSGCECQPEQLSAIPSSLDPSLVLLLEDLDNRILWLNSAIGKENLDIIRYIQSFNREDMGIPVSERKPIRIMIHTHGGDLEVALSIVDAILTSSTPVITINMGTAASGGFFILLAGSSRYCTQHSSAMVHPGSAKFDGTFDQFRTFTADYERTINDLKEYILSRSTLDGEQLGRLWGSDMYLSPAEQVRYGIVNQIIAAENKSVLL